MPKNVLQPVRNIEEKIMELVNRTYNNATKSVKVNVKVPEGFVSEPVQESQVKALSNKKFEIIAKLASIIFPAVLAFLGLVLQEEFLLKSNAVVIFLAGVGGILGTFIPTFQNKNSAEDLSRASRPKLLREDIKTQVVADDEAESKFLLEIRPEIETLVKNLSAVPNVEIVRNLQPDDLFRQSFGEWAQRFIIYADSQPDNRKIQRMRDDFIAELQLMGVIVYDELDLDAEGKPNVPRPVEDYLIFDPTIQNFTKLERPAIYSDNRIFVRGKIS